MDSTCDLYDVFLERTEVLALPWRSFGGRDAFFGLAQTVRCFDDNTQVRATLETPGQGRVLVVDGAGSLTHALMGDNVALLALDNGWAGVVIAGAVRDSVEIGRLDLGAFALGTVPRKSRKEGGGVVGEAVTVGGGRVCPGDLVVADPDGVVAVPAALASGSGLLPAS